MIRFNPREYDIFRFPAGRVLTSEDLQTFIGYNDTVNKKRYKPLGDAYKNNYEIYTAPRKQPWKPNNKIGVNFAQYITDTFEGFFLGNGVRITSEDEEAGDLAGLFDAYNTIDDKNSELSKIVSIYGRGYEIYYIDKAGEQKTHYVEPTQSFMIYDEGLDPDPLYFVHTYYDFEGNRKGSISDGTSVRYFDMNPSVQWTSEPIPHGYGMVPATEYVQNSQRRGIFESVLPLINAYNRALSEKANDLDTFSDAYLKVIGAKIDEETIRFMRTSRVINFDGLDAQNVTVDFMSKPNADESQEHFFDRVEKLIFTIAMVCNISDTSFATTSGIALQYKTMPMLNLMATKKLKFIAGLTRRYKAIFGNPIAGVNPGGWMKLTYTIVPNIPEDLEGEANAVSKLTGITSRETQLARLSFITDPAAEMRKIEEEDTGTDIYSTERTVNENETDAGTNRTDTENTSGDS